MAMPSSGTKKISPKSIPQKAPPRAPAAVRPESWRVFGFFAPSGKVTSAASWILMSSFCWSSLRVCSARSAPSGEGNFQTVMVAMCFSRV